MIREAMEYFVLAVLALTDVAVLGTQEFGSIKCVQVCRENSNIIECDQSLILITDVTDVTMVTNSIALENIKRVCMGRNSCNQSRSCPSTQRDLLVHYSCVNASNIHSGALNRIKAKLNVSYGHIQSPGYPGLTDISSSDFRWEMQPPNDSAVVLTLNDIAIPNNEVKCERLLMVYGLSCNNKQTSPHQFCGRDNITSIVICGHVEILLVRNTRFEGRFWLSFRVYPKSQMPSLRSPVSHCSNNFLGIKHWHDGVFTTDANSLSGIGSQDTNTEVLVIMLSIISGISAVLLAILIVVCVRCRLLQASHAELAYSEPSPSLPAHYMFISSSEPEKARPQLAEGYFEVSDALHFTQRVDSPTTPAYAEVEQFPDPREVFQSSSSEEISRRSSLANKEKHYESISESSEDKQKDSSGVSVDTSKSNLKVSRKLKKETIKQGYTENSTNSKSTPTSAKTEAALSVSLVTTQAGFHSQPHSDDNGSSGYEAVGKYPLVKSCSNSDQRPQVPSNHPRAKTISSEHLPTFLEKTYSLIGMDMKTDSHDKISSSTLSEKNRTVHNMNLKAPFKTTQTNKSFKDMPRTSGIVKNGIKKFELNSI